MKITEQICETMPRKHGYESSFSCTQKIANALRAKCACYTLQLWNCELHAYCQIV